MYLLEFCDLIQKFQFEKDHLVRRNEVMFLSDDEDDGDEKRSEREKGNFRIK